MSGLGWRKHSVEGPRGGREAETGLSFQRKFPPLSVAIGYGPDHPRASREVLRRQGARF